MKREAAVAVIRLISPLSGPNPRYLILRRALNQLDPWSGHFAFPGGRRDPDDATLLATCLRETREECGFTLPETTLVGTLPVAQAGTALGHPVPVTPYLFELSHPPEVILDTRECAAFHWVPETWLRSPDHQTRIMPLPGSNRDFPAVRLEDGHIWGFTYNVLADLLDLPRDMPKEHGNTEQGVLGG